MPGWGDRGMDDGAGVRSDQPDHGELVGSLTVRP